MMTKFYVVLFLITLLLYSHAQTCTKIFNSVGATFDLSPLILDQESYTVGDNSASRDYTYIFNICGSVSILPSLLCVPPNSNFNNSDLSLYDGPLSSAYQLSKTNCFSLGNFSNQTTWNLIDESDPLSGLIVTYRDGSWSSGCNRNREFSLRFFCSPHSTPRSLNSNRVSEKKTLCEFSIDLSTIYACPLECQTDRNAICSKHGKCAMDTSISSPRCFCNSGYSGSDCSVLGEVENSSSLSLDVLGIILVIVLILLLILNIAAFLLYLRIKHFKPVRADTDSNAFEADDQKFGIE